MKLHNVKGCKLEIQKAMTKKEWEMTDFKSMPDTYMKGTDKLEIMCVVHKGQKKSRTWYIYVCFHSVSCSDEIMIIFLKRPNDTW